MMWVAGKAAKDTDHIFSEAKLRIEALTDRFHHYGQDRKARTFSDKASAHQNVEASLAERELGGLCAVGVLYCP